jgi:acyl-CoA hydrolase
MDNRALVRPEHLNHHGFLFGGQMLKWVDEYAWLAASLDFPGCTLLTMALNDIVFKHRVANGSILRFNTTPLRQGASSMTYRVRVYAAEQGCPGERDIFETTITFVRVGPQGRKEALPALNSYPSADPPVPTPPGA